MLIWDKYENKYRTVIDVEDIKEKIIFLENQIDDLKELIKHVEE